MTRLADEDKPAALLARRGRLERHAPESVGVGSGGRVSFRPVDNAALQAGSPMFFICKACFGPVILAEDFLTAQAICYDCRDLADRGWIAQRADGVWEERQEDDTEWSGSV